MSGQAELWKREFVLHSSPSLLCTQNGIVHTINDAGLSLLGSISTNATLQSMFGVKSTSLQAIFSELKADVVITHPIVLHHQVYTESKKKKM